jgi:hypothetical protein
MSVSHIHLFDGETEVCCLFIKKDTNILGPHHLTCMFVFFNNMYFDMNFSINCVRR